MQTFRSRCARVGAVGAALVLGVAGLSLISAIPASAAPTPTPVNEFFSFAGPTGFGQLGTTGAAGSPTTASQGSNFAITIPGGSQAVPTNQSGVAVNFISGVTQFYEVGAGKVLSGLIKRIADGATGTAIGTPEDIAAFASARAR